jgi:hypothetical protein
VDVENTGLKKEELDFLIERLSREDDESPLLDTDSELVNQADLRTRLQRGIEDLRSNNEDVPAELLRLLERL